MFGSVFIVSLALAALITGELWILWSVLCYVLARWKNRDTKLAILLGIFGGLFAVAYYVAVPSKKKQAK